MVADTALRRFRVGVPKQEPNPQTWVRDAWERAGVDQLDTENRPAGVTETDWYILRRHVLNVHPYADIARAYSEPTGRIQEFAEAATRLLIPQFALGAQASSLEGVDPGEASARVGVFVGAENLYRALGSPLGDDPGAVGQFLNAISMDAGIVQTLRDILAENPIQVQAADNTAGVKTSSTPAREPEER